MEVYLMAVCKHADLPSHSAEAICMCSAIGIFKAKNVQTSRVVGHDQS